MHIVLSSGGTGGHVFPALALGKSLENDGHTVTYVTDQRGAKFFKNQPFYLAPIYRHNRFLKSLIYPLSLGWQITRCFFHFLFNRPDICVGFGGYPSIPAMIACKLLNIDLYLHEQNSVCGQANRFIAKWAKCMALSFKDTAKIPPRTKTIFTGNMVRQEIAALKNSPLKESDKFSILVTGGSQGARLFAKMIPDTLNNLQHEQLKKIHIVQQCRNEDLAELTSTFQSLKISFELQQFFDDMPSRYLECDIIIARSGASTVAEVLTIGRPAIYVPLKISKESDQARNADYCVNKSLAWVIEEYDNDTLLNVIEQMMKKNALHLIKESLGKENYPDGIKGVKNMIGVK